MHISYTLVRSKRRTLSLVVEADGRLTARAPLRMPKGEIEAFIRQKESWIVEKQALAKERQATQESNALGEGQPLPFRGETLVLRLAQVPFPFAYDGHLLLPQQAEPAQSLALWLRQEAHALLPERVEAQGQRMGLRPTSLRFTTARTRWGSMSGRGLMRLNLALLLCPPPVEDYVIIHELAHLRHPNHSPAFWALVEQWCPGYRAHKAWLKQNAHLIRLLQAAPGEE